MSEKHAGPGDMRPGMAQDRHPPEQDQATTETADELAREAALDAAIGELAETDPLTAPAGTEGHLDPARFRSAISMVLAGGVTVSGALIVAGLATALVVGWRTSLIGGPHGSTNVADFGAVFDNLGQVRPIGFAQLGLAVLLATPTLRVVASMIGFALERDRLYVFVSGTVLTILIVSILFVR